MTSHAAHSDPHVPHRRVVTAASSAAAAAASPSRLAPSSPYGRKSPSSASSSSLPSNALPSLGSRRGHSNSSSNTSSSSIRKCGYMTLVLCCCAWSVHILQDMTASSSSSLMNDASLSLSGSSSSSNVVSGNNFVIEKPVPQSDNNADDPSLSSSSAATAQRETARMFGSGEGNETTTTSIIVNSQGVRFSSQPPQQQPQQFPRTFPRVAHLDFQFLFQDHYPRRNTTHAKLRRMRYPPKKVRYPMASEAHFIHLEKSRDFRSSLLDPMETNDCEPLHKWQLESKPNCNKLHEMDLSSLFRYEEEVYEEGEDDDEEGDSEDDEADDEDEEDSEDEEEENGNKENNANEEARDSKKDRKLRRRRRNRHRRLDKSSEFQDRRPHRQTALSRMKLIAHGYWADVWQYVDDATYEKYVVKTLRYEHPITGRNIDRNRRDSLAMERLTSAKYVVNTYGYCSISGIVEYSEGGDIDNALWGNEKKDKPLSSLDKLRMVTQGTMGLASVHNIDEEGRASIAHTDISTGQFIYIHGKLKLNDFNRARFLLRNKTDTSKNCPYTVGLNPGKTRSPEEYKYEGQSEKVDVFSFGYVIYTILNMQHPNYALSSDDAKESITNGTLPRMRTFIVKSDDPIIQGIAKAMRMCFEYDQFKRISSRELESYMKSLMHKYDPGTLEKWGDA